MSGRSASPAPQPEPAAAAGWLIRHEGRVRGLLLLSAVLGLLAGICGGLWRLGWVLPHGAGLAILHGPLMISGLFGSLISLERAVALGGGWPYLGPVLAAGGSLALLAGAPPALGASAHVLASGVLVAASMKIVREQPALFTGVLLLGATAWMTGNFVWLTGGAVPDAAGWWLAFLILTIAGERLEMSRLIGAKRGSQTLFVAAVALLGTGAAAGLTSAIGALLFGGGLLVTLVWLLRHDIARRTIRQSGQTRFFAACMLAGYPWLGIAGALLLVSPPAAYAMTYDMAVHAIGIGFVLSMVFGHALIIFPAVTGITLHYHPVLYGPLAILHVSMLLRLSAGLFDMAALRLASGLLTVMALLAFAACVVLARSGLFNSVTARSAATIQQTRESRHDNHGTH